MLPAGDFRVQFAMSTYYVEEGEQAAVTVHPTNPAVGLNEYRMFLWDFNGDGETDAVTESPEARYTYPGSYDGPISVTAVNLDDGRTTASAHMIVKANIDAEFARSGIPGVPSNVQLSKIANNTLEVAWTPADAFANTWVVQVNDSPGQRVKLDESSKVTIGDIDLSQPVTIRVRGVTSDGTLGDTAMVGWQPNGTTTQRDEYAAGLKRASISGDDVDTPRTDALGSTDPPSATVTSIHKAQQSHHDKAPSSSVRYQDWRVWLAVAGGLTGITASVLGVRTLLLHRKSDEH